MEVVACSRCRRLFNYISGPKTCPNCLEAQEEEFQKVKKYIQENKGLKYDNERRNHHDTYEGIH